MPVNVARQFNQNKQAKDGGDKRILVQFDATPEASILPENDSKQRKPTRGKP